MKNISKYLLISFVICLLGTSCNKNSNQPETENPALDEANRMFLRYDAMTNTEKLEHLDLLDSCIANLDDVLKKYPNNAAANYLMGYALERKENGGTTVLNFELIDRSKTEKISKYFEKAITDTKFLPDYKQSQYSKITVLWDNLALNYSLKGKPDSAAVAMEHCREIGGLRPANLEYAENILKNLPPNAILIVDTDLETACLRYLQYIKGLRQDVSVLNYLLFDYQWYAKWISFPINLTAPVETELSDTDLYGLYTGLTEDKRTQTIAGIEVTPKGSGKSQDGKAEVSINDKIMLAVIDKNLRRRPICFSITAAKHVPYSTGFAEYIALHGLIAELHTEKISLSKSVAGDEISDMLLNRFQFDKFMSGSARLDRDVMFIELNYRFVFSQELFYFSEFASDKSGAKAIIGKFDAVFPPSHFPRTKEETAILKKLK